MPLYSTFLLLLQFSNILQFSFDFCFSLYSWFYEGFPIINIDFISWFERFGWLASCSAVISPRKCFMIFLYIYMPFFSKSGLRNFKSSISSLQRWFSPPIFSAFLIAILHRDLLQTIYFFQFLSGLLFPFLDRAQDSDRAHFWGDGSTIFRHQTTGSLDLQTWLDPIFPAVRTVKFNYS